MVAGGGATGLGAAALVGGGVDEDAVLRHARDVVAPECGGGASSARGAFGGDDERAVGEGALEVLGRRSGDHEPGLVGRDVAFSGRHEPQGIELRVRGALGGGAGGVAAAQHEGAWLGVSEGAGELEAQVQGGFADHDVGGASDGVVVIGADALVGEGEGAASAQAIDAGEVAAEVQEGADEVIGAEGGAQLAVGRCDEEDDAAAPNELGLGGDRLGAGGDVRGVVEAGGRACALGEKHAVPRLDESGGVRRDERDARLARALAEDADVHGSDRIIALARPILGSWIRA